MPAPHFQPEAIKFLRGLKRNNDREWFEPRKAIYEAALKAPLLSVIAAINEAMHDFAPDNVRLPQKAMMRIYRDVRFSPNKSPYKTQVAAWWARTGLEKTSGGGFYFHLSSTELTVAAGVYMPEREQLLAIRTYLLEHHAELRKLLDGNVHASTPERLRRSPPCHTRIRGMVKSRKPGRSEDFRKIHVHPKDLRRFRWHPGAIDADFTWRESAIEFRFPYRSEKQRWPTINQQQRVPASWSSTTTTTTATR